MKGLKKILRFSGPAPTRPYMCRAGTAVLKDATGFRDFYSRNSWALLAAAGVVLLHLGGFPIKNKVGSGIMTSTTCLMLDNMLEAYMYSTGMMVTPDGVNSMLGDVSLTWKVMLMPVVFIHIIAIWSWVMFFKVGSLVTQGSILCRCKWMIPVTFLVGNFVTVFLFGRVMMYGY